MPHIDRPAIIGLGPAGIFAALELIERGEKPIVFERGRTLEERHNDIQEFIKSRKLNTESNIQFGEGGAGSYSDGKLFSRVNNTKYGDKVLKTFIKFGAPEEIATIRKPHLGTDMLCEIVMRMRKYIQENGGDIFYNAKLTDLIISDGTLTGIEINCEKKYYPSKLFLAIGNSARDTFEMIYYKNIAIEAKPITVGVRLEHSSALIKRIRNGVVTYSFNHTNRKSGRGAYTFCMCPGGEIVNASSENGMLALNGMSYAARASAYSNAAIVVNCGVSDYPSIHPLAGIEFQREIEQKAFKAGGSEWHVPAQNLIDFIKNIPSETLRTNSCKTGVRSADLRTILPSFVIDTLLEAFGKWSLETPEFISEEGILLAPETRTSSPVSILRNENFMAIGVKNLYPIGEGSGYSGGITSAATDAIKAVEAIF
jgi:uncharacterized FAD-dependent dehydrogenase